MFFNATEKCVLKRPSLLQLNAATARLKNEGWQVDSKTPVLVAAVPGEEQHWWISMRRSVPIKFGRSEASGPGRKSAIPATAGSDRDIYESYSPALGLL